MSVRKNTDFKFEDGKIIRQENETETKPGENINPETENRRMLENYKQKIARKEALKKTTVLAVIMFLSTFIILAALYFLFRIQSVSISGSAVYSEQELIEALGIDNGKSSLIFTTKASIEDKLRRTYPSLDKIKISKVFPDKLVIEVTDGTGLYYIYSGGDYFVLTPELKAISSSKEKPGGLVELRCGELSRIIIGEIMEFGTDTQYNYLKNLLSDIREHELSPHIVRVDATDRFDIKLKYDDIFILEIGKAEDTPVKLTMVKNAILKIGVETKGIIDVKNTDVGAFRPSDDID